MPISRYLLPCLWFLAFLAAVWTTRTANWNEVFVDGQVYFEDGDCYSRMTRVQQVLAHPFTPIRTHSFENAPFGVTPHTTAPLDWLIAILARLTNLDFAGAFISPILGLLLGIFLWWRTRYLRFGDAVLVFFVLSPILAHAFELGRPDHQSLILFLVGVALGAEFALWKKTFRAWAVVSAVAWALALWVSLFEPLILLVVTMLSRVAVMGRKGFARDYWPAGAAFAGILLFALLFDGWRFQLPAGEVHDYFSRWAINIGELHPANFATLLSWAGWLVLISPALLLFRAWREKSRECIAIAALVILCAALTMWNARWGYFLALICALSLPWALSAIPWRTAAWILFVLSLWPMAKAWETELYPNPGRQREIAEKIKDDIQLRQVANALIAPGQNIILAPWWLSPPLAYWSGQPCVAGSSHQSLPGIVDTARFYLAQTPAEAAAILEKRHVSYVVAYEPDRILPNSSQLLAQEAQPRALGKMLYHFPARAPGFLELVYQNDYFKVYEVKHR